MTSAPSAQAPARGLRIVLAQLNTTVGDIAGNKAKIIGAIGQARALGADLVVCPELGVCGYPPEDLLLRPSFLAASEAAIGEIAQHARGLVAAVGFPDRVGDALYNAAAVLANGQTAAVVHKAYLPNYSVFDEQRYFDAGDTFPVFDLPLAGGGTVRFGVSICEDIWYPSGPPQLQALAGAEVLVNLSASPYVKQKAGERERMLATRAADNGAFVVYCNLVGGQDELVFDGNSVVFAPDGAVIARGASFKEDLLAVDIATEQAFRTRLLDPRVRKTHLWTPEPGQTPVVALRAGDRESADPGPSAAAGRESAKPGALSAGGHDFATPGTPFASEAHAATRAKEGAGQPQPDPLVAPRLDGLAEIWAALVLATRDYVRKNRFQKLVLGLSGGIDSALCGVLAVDALGPEQVVGVAMPSRFSSPTSLEDAEVLCANLGIPLHTLPIDGPFQAYLDALAGEFAGRPADVTEENLQPRVRGNLLMALSNKFGWLVLTTGNKSEVSCGYATLYGDTAGGFAPLKDVLKTTVYALARWRNAQTSLEAVGGLGPVAGRLPSGAAAGPIPEHSITRVPSAELKPGQTDQDTLPPYELLDPILVAYIEEECSVEEIIGRGYDRAMVERVARMVDRAEYKRRQSPPGVKISGRAFGRDRRMPITRGG